MFFRIRFLSLCEFLVLLCVIRMAGASSPSNEVSMGTTLVALKFDKGVVVAADTRTSVSGYVSNKFARKINVLVDTSDASCAICRSGSAADTQFLARHAKNEFEYSRQWRYQLDPPSVSQVAHYLRDKMRSESEPLQASLICAGYDKDNNNGDGEGRIFGILPGGSLWEEEVFCVSGSGSTVLMGHLDSLKLDSSNLYSEEEAIGLVTKLLRLSIARDGSSGGLIRIMVLKQGGVQELTVYPEAQTSRELPGFAKVASLTTSATTL
jgi:20S proteasome subunit beta 1